MKFSLENINVTEVKLVVDKLVEEYSDVLIWTFEGNLGAGKTTLIKALAERFNLQDQVSSPTFNYVNDYDGKVYHFDCYRLENVEEALNFGFEEYLDSGKRCWIEWPEVVLPLIESNYLEIQIKHNSDSTRTYTIIKH